MNRCGWCGAITLTLLAWAAGAVSTSQAADSTANSDGSDALRQIFAPAGAPNFKTVIEAEMTFSASVTVEKDTVTSAADGIVSTDVTRLRTWRLAGQDVKCTMAGSVAQFFGRFQAAHAAMDVACAGTSLHTDVAVETVTDLSGHLFPPARDNELTYSVQFHKEGVIFDIFKGPIKHRMIVLGVLDGIALNVTGRPDVIYLIRDEEDDGFKGDKPFLTDIYWSSALHWPVQRRMRSHEKNLTFVEVDVIHVGGIGPYSLPDGRRISTVDARTDVGGTAEQIAAMAEAIRASIGTLKQLDLAAGRRQAARIADETAPPAEDLDPAFASIAPFVTKARAPRK